MEQTIQYTQARLATTALIPTTEIDDRPQHNCRGKIVPADVDFLAKAISTEGLLQYPVVRPVELDGFKYRVVAGFSRILALKILRWKEIPCSIRTDIDDLTACFLNLSENLTRKDLNFIQEAEAVRNLGLRYPNMDDEMIGERLGQTRQWVQMRLFALNFPEEVREVIKKGFMTYAHIMACHKKKSSYEQIEFARLIKEARERGATIDLRKKTKDPLIKPKVSRGREEIFRFQDHVVQSYGTHCFATRCLAWAAGEITDFDIFDDLGRLCKHNNIPYTKPKALYLTELDKIRGEG